MLNAPVVVVLFTIPVVNALVPGAKSVPLVAAVIAVPVPLNTPVILVPIVMSGVELLVATVPEKPFALVTLTLVTVPTPAPPDTASTSFSQREPLYFNTWPATGEVIVTSLNVLKLPEITEPGTHDELTAFHTNGCPAVGTLVAVSTSLSALMLVAE